MTDLLKVFIINFRKTFKGAKTMDNLNLTTDIQPVTEFRANTAEILETLRKNRRPIILTQHGRPAAVLESVEEYQRKQEELSFLKGLLSGMKDAESGNVEDGEEIYHNLKKRMAGQVIKLLVQNHPVSISGEDLLGFAGTIESDDLKTITTAIEEGCERIDHAGW